MANENNIVLKHPAALVDHLMYTRTIAGLYVASEATC
jgi:hypothetical protein